MHTHTDPSIIESVLLKGKEHLNSILMSLFFSNNMNKVMSIIIKSQCRYILLQYTMDMKSLHTPVKIAGFSVVKKNNKKNKPNKSGQIFIHSLSIPHMSLPYMG